MQQPQQSNEDIEAKIQKAVTAERQIWDTQFKINQLTKEIEDHKNEKLLLQKELKEARAEVEGTTHRLLSRVEPHLGTLIAAFLPQKMMAAAPGIAGSGQQINFETKDDLTDRLETALNLWAETETMEEIIFLIEKIAALTKNNAGTYAMAKNILKA